MPHLVTNRRRVANLRQSDPDHVSHELWETVNTVAYDAGGITFVLGSVLFFPAFGAFENVGAWLFFVGSLLYLLVTGHDLLEVIKFWRVHDTHTLADRVEYFAAGAYALGTVLFTVGSLCFLPWWDWTIAGAWMFIIGSLLFVAGGVINMLQVVRAPSLIYVQLFGLTIVTFVTGAALFVVASIPYLWTLQAQPDQKLVFGFSAWQYLAGSALFLAGGSFIYVRKIVRGRLEESGYAYQIAGVFIHALRQEIKERGQLRSRRGS